MSYSVKDSSIWRDRDSYKLLNNKDCAVRVGVIREEVYIESLAQTKYIVEVWHNGNIAIVSCVRTCRFGGIYNYEEFSNRGFFAGQDTSSSMRSLLAGEHVLVAYLNGDSREGVIIASINHSGREESIKSKIGAARKNNVEFLNRDADFAPTKYASEFNGVETLINSRGEYRVTFKGQPTNLAKLNEATKGDRIEVPKYDEEIGSSYCEFDKTGSYFITDNSKDGAVQSIKIDKPNGKIIIVSGNTSLTIDKKEESYTIVNKKVTFNTADEWNLNTKKTTIKSTNLIQAEAKDIKTKGKWDQTGDISIKGNIKQAGNTEITGDLKNSGQALLAGGSYPLIYDIILTIGVGNLGAPVISTNVLLKTTMTKAT
jgi:phage gp45-like